eukprot:TRINITY_DN19614_c0_g1_i1.p1 TRINITY_DN19614_c0_g1~~TRINITY_DN19614_c0_g1_i1.p1  ORF type:complete len:218 (+),score=69.54 TRINITY_DN19614_c0_g1_i1:55-708(+)
MLNLLLLLGLFICGLIYLFYFSPKRQLSWFRSLLPTLSLSTATTTPPRRPAKSAEIDKAEIAAVFAAFDRNGDGFVTKKELGEFLWKLGLISTEKEVENMFEKLDSNGDGFIDADEFSKLYTSLLMGGGQGVEQGEDGAEEDGDLREAFKVFDGNGDGLITVDELGLVLSSLGFKQGMKMEDCRNMIRQVDMDGDGMINFTEFKKMMKDGKLSGVAQ